ncbi:MAG: TetR/AcrR family transcriptional regulator [Candidatus Hermodarchaeota archaeon]
MKTTREKIVEEALKSFLTQGYEKTSLNDLANRVNITKPAIYHYFHSKQELLSTVLRYLLNMINKAHEQLYHQDISLETTLEYLFDSIKNIEKLFQDSTGFTTGKFNYHRFFFDCAKYLPTSSMIEESSREHERFLTARIKQAQETKQISSKLDAEALSFQIIATLEGMYLISLYRPSLEINKIAQKVFSNMRQLLIVDR